MPTGYESVQRLKTRKLSLFICANFDRPHAKSLRSSPEVGVPIKATNTQRVTARLSPPIYLSAKLSPDSNKTTAPADNHFPATRDKKIIGIGGKKKE